MARLAGRRTWGRTSRLGLAVLCCIYLAQPAPAACPSADFTGDCFVDFEDFAILATQWPTSDFNDIAVMAGHWLTPDPRVPDDMAYIPGGTFEMGDRFSEEDLDELPVHTVTVDSFCMGKCEVTNQQYCDFLNWASDNGWVTVTDGVAYQAGSGTSYPYCSTSSAPSGYPHYGGYSQISYSGGFLRMRMKPRGRVCKTPAR